MEQRLTLLTLGVDDYAGMRQFYTEVFGWEPAEASNENITFFQLNGIQLALFGREELTEDAAVRSEGNGFRSFTLAHNLRSEQEVDELFDQLTRKDAEIAKNPKGRLGEDTAAI